MSAFDPQRVFAELLRGRPDVADAILGPDPSRFVAWCEPHRLGPLCHRLAAEGSQLRRALRHQSLQAHMADLATRAWAQPLLAMASERSIEVWAFKGCGIAHLAAVYETPAERPLGDLDLLVDRSSLEAFVDCAAELEFVAQRSHPDHYQVPLWHPRHGLLEIHHRLYADFLEEHERRIKGRSTRRLLFGVPSRVFANADMYLVLAAHFFRNDVVPWIWLAELALLADAMEEREWELVAEEAVAGGHAVFVVGALRCASTLWERAPSGLPAEVRAKLDAHCTRLERAAIGSVVRTLCDGPFRGRDLLMARRLSGRPYRRGGFAVMFGPNPGGSIAGGFLTKIAGRAPDGLARAIRLLTHREESES